MVQGSYLQRPVGLPKMDVRRSVTWRVTGGDSSCKVGGGGGSVDE